MMRKVYLSKLIHDDNWDAIRVDMNKRPINPPAKLQEIVGDGNVDGNSDKDRILKALAYYGIENNKVTLWGDGSPLREFLWSEDMADASVHILLNVDFSDIIGIEKYSSVFYGVRTDGEVNRNNSEGRGGAIRFARRNSQLPYQRRNRKGNDYQGDSQPRHTHSGFRGRTGMG